MSQVQPHDPKEWRLQQDDLWTLLHLLLLAVFECHCRVCHIPTIPIGSLYQIKKLDVYANFTLSTDHTVLVFAPSERRSTK